MDEADEAIIEATAIAGWMYDSAVKIKNDYPDLPEEIMIFIKMAERMFEAAGTVFDRPQTDEFVRDLIADL